MMMNFERRLASGFGKENCATKRNLPSDFADNMSFLEKSKAPGP
jgi:hypothetical protein